MRHPILGSICIVPILVAVYAVVFTAYAVHFVEDVAWTVKRFMGTR